MLMYSRRTTNKFKRLSTNMGGLKYMVEKTKMSDKINFFTLFWLFLIGSIGGIFAEGAWQLVKYGHWENHPATIWGPFCIIYGIGLVAIYIVSCFLENQNILVKFIAFAVVGTIVEYAGSWFQEIVLGSVSWDYSSEFMNIGGRVSLKMSIIWGILGTVFMYLLYPFVNRMLASVRNHFSQKITIVFAVFMTIDLLVTTVVLIRWKDRVHDISPKNQIEVLIDNRYNNEKMEKRYPKIEIIKEN